MARLYCKLGNHWGESGPKARPASPDWFRSIQLQCMAADVPFHFKQGDWAPGDGVNLAGRRAIQQQIADDGTPMLRLGKKAAGRRLDGAEWDELPTRMRPVGQLSFFPDGAERSEKPASNLPLEDACHTTGNGRGCLQRKPMQSPALSLSTFLAFQLVTRGGLYIDGFAAPQSRNHPEAWTARRVLEISPPRLRTFWLCDNDPGGIEQLRQLRDAHSGKPPVRRVYVLEGDFNARVEDIVRSGRIKRRTAVFALLDQRNTECHWSTVKRLAEFKGRTRIELLYFLGIGWLLRSLTQSRTPERIAQIDQWWGGSGWNNLKGRTQLEITVEVASRFQKSWDTGTPMLGLSSGKRTEGRRLSFYTCH